MKGDKFLPITLHLNLFLLLFNFPGDVVTALSDLASQTFDPSGRAKAKAKARAEEHVRWRPGRGIAWAPFRVPFIRLEELVRLQEDRRDCGGLGNRLGPNGLGWVDSQVAVPGAEGPGP
ncbi:protein kinase superfamily protein [Striga asiatica]|uniref:Protein kinase superfamily protein n=1 Tax=Striga asiatica TaxID=4170 RepID=A0A5A7PUG6_STRAF|nr:protein kinase superfamily protein [Striga asiatica]